MPKTYRQKQENKEGEPTPINKKKHERDEESSSEEKESPGTKAKKGPRPEKIH